MRNFKFWLFIKNQKALGILTRIFMPDDELQRMELIFAQNNPIQVHKILEKLILRRDGSFINVNTGHKIKNFIRYEYKDKGYE